MFSQGGKFDLTLRPRPLLVPSLSNWAHAYAQALTETQDVHSPFRSVLYGLSSTFQEKS